MNANRLLIIQCTVLASLLTMAAPQQAVAGGLHIHTVNMGGEPPPPDAIVGGGNLPAIVEAAAKRWERVFRKGPAWDITLEYEWYPLTGVGYGFEEFQEQGGTPVRPTRARLLFRNGHAPSGFYDWFADPTPEDDSHYEHYESVLMEVLDVDGEPIGELNLGRIFSTETGPAAGHIDLLTVAMHEIGHALGLDDKYEGNRNQSAGTSVVITEPLPFAGLEVFLQTSTHINYLSYPLMNSEPVPGWRNLITSLDALVIAQFTSFKKPDLSDPPGVPNVTPVVCCHTVVGPQQTPPPTLPDAAQ